MATIDLTLNAIKIPALDGYTPPFGTKKVTGGLTTQEVNDNIIAPFVKERPIEITEDSSTGSVEYNASLVINSADAVLTLGSGTYVGCTVKVIAATAGSVSYNSGTTDTLAAGQIVIYIWGGSSWVPDNSRIIDMIYPVGSIYMSANNVSPSTFIGGTWEQIKDTFLLSAGDTYTAGSSGGEPTHTLTAAEMPKHTHYTNLYGVGGAANGTGNPYHTYMDLAATVNYYTSETGGDQPHNNMPPYLVVYMWKRTA